MSDRAEIVKQSEILNQVVLDRASMQELGQIEVLWMYPKVHRVLGFICKSGWRGAKKTAFNLDQLDAIGSNGVLVNSPPVETDAEKVRQLESMIGCEVWTDAGDRVGKITDYLFDLETGDIEHYLYVSNGWSGITGSVYRLPPNYILKFGKQRVMVPAGAVESFAVYRAGIQDKFSKVTDLLKEEKSQVTQEVRSVMELAREKARILAAQAKEKARSVTEQAYEFVEEITLDEPDTPSTSSDPDPWDDWEVEPPKPIKLEPKQSTASANNPAQPPKTEPKRSTNSAPAADVWDDEEPWL